MTQLNDARFEAEKDVRRATREYKRTVSAARTQQAQAALESERAAAAAAVAAAAAAAAAAEAAAEGGDREEPKEGGVKEEGDDASASASASASATGPSSKPDAAAALALPPPPPPSNKPSGEVEAPDTPEVRSTAARLEAAYASLGEAKAKLEDYEREFASLRGLPLGEDRFRNSYWYFLDEPRLYVHLRSARGTGLAYPEGWDADEATAAALAPPPPRGAGGEWAVYTREEEVRRLAAALCPGGGGEGSCSGAGGCAALPVCGHGARGPMRVQTAAAIAEADQCRCRCRRCCCRCGGGGRTAAAAAAAAAAMEVKPPEPELEVEGEDTAAEDAALAAAMIEVRRSGRSRKAVTSYDPTGPGADDGSAGGRPLRRGVRSRYARGGGNAEEAAAAAAEAEAVQANIRYVGLHPAVWRLPFDVAADAVACLKLELRSVEGELLALLHGTTLLRMLPDGRRRVRRAWAARVEAAGGFREWWSRCWTWKAFVGPSRWHAARPTRPWCCTTGCWRRRPRRSRSRERAGEPAGAGAGPAGWSGRGRGRGICRCCCWWWCWWCCGSPGRGPGEEGEALLPWMWTVGKRRRKRRRTRCSPAARGPSRMTRRRRRAAASARARMRMMM